MPRNESLVDRVIRVVVGLVLLLLGFAGIVSGGLGLFFEIVGVLLVLTGAIGFCPLYALLKIKTYKPRA
jgi:hypothetical protein